jgi:hypothetical protein
LKILPPDLGDLEKLEKLDISLNPVIEQIDKAAKVNVRKLKEYLKSDDYDAIYYREKKKLNP